MLTLNAIKIDLTKKKSNKLFSTKVFDATKHQGALKNIFSAKVLTVQKNLRKEWQ